MRGACARQSVRVAGFIIALLSILGGSREARLFAAYTFPPEAVAGWNDLSAFEKSVEGRGLEERVLSEATGDTVSHTQIHFIYVDGYVLAANEVVDGGNRQVRSEVLCVGPRYNFQLTRQADQESWILDYVGNKDREAIFERASRVVVGKYSEVSTRVLGVPLQLLINQPGFKILNVEPSEAEGSTFLKVHFEYEPSPEFEKRQYLRGGWVEVWPANHWAVRRYYAKTPWTTVQCDVDYGELLGDFRAVKSVQQITVGPEATLTCTLTYDQYRKATLNEEDFVLSTFGMAEPGKPQERPTRWWVVSLNTGVVLVLFSVYLYRQSQKKKGH